MAVLQRFTVRIFYSLKNDFKTMIKQLRGWSIYNEGSHGTNSLSRASLLPYTKNKYREGRDQNNWIYHYGFERRLVRGSRGVTGGPDPPPPTPKNPQNIGFLSNTGPDHLKITKHNLSVHVAIQSLALTLKAPSIICSRRQFQIVPLFQK